MSPLHPPQRRQRPVGPVRSICLILLAILVTALAAPASALDLGFDLGSSGHHLQHRSSYPLTATQQIDTLSLRAGVGVRPDVHVEVEWRTGDQAARRFHELSTVLESDSILAGARWQKRPFPWLEPFVRAAAGATSTWLALNYFPTYSTRNWSPQLAAGAGVDLLIPREVFRRAGAARPSGFTLGLTFELGWQHTFTQPLKLTGNRSVQTTDTDPPQQIPQSDLDLGSLTLTGWTTRVALVVRL